MTRILGIALLTALLGACTDDGGTTDGLTSNPTDGGEDTGNTPVATPFESFDDADLTDAATVQALTAASSPNVFAVGYAAAVTASNSSDAKCPTVVENKATGTTVYTGGCTSTNGRTFAGVVTLVENLKGEGGTITFEDYSYSQDEDCTGGSTVAVTNAFDGELVLEDNGSFSVNLAGTLADADLDLCTAVDRDLAIDYDGSVVGIGGKSTQTWSGSGQYGLSGFGKVDAQTFSEILDGDCASEADSGTTVLNSGSDEVVITYDGAVDCDKVSTVTWSLNGTVQGELGGVSCSTGGLGASGVLALAGLLLVRRRRED